MESSKLIIDAVGWASMVLLLAAYLLLANKKVNNNSPVYHSFNLIGGVGFGTVSILTGLWFIFFLEIFWAGIAFFSLVRIFKERK